MTDIDFDGDDGRSRPNRGLIAVVAVALVGAVVAAIVLLGGDDDESGDIAITAPTDVATELETTEDLTPSADAPATGDAPAPTAAPETTEPADVTEAPATTQDPATTESPATTEAPGTTESPATTEAPATTEVPETTTSPGPGPTDLSFVISDIEDGGTIPTRFTCDGNNEAPTIEIEAIPEGVLQLAMVVDDPDAPTDDPFVHWVVYGIPGNSTGFSDADPALTYGTNDAALTEWFGPCPPAGDGPHEYVFALYGLDRELALDPGLDGRELEAAIADSVVVETSIAASYELT